MPTGYTADIENDISFEDYALQCARAFGACVMQRDDSSTARPVLREVSTTYAEWLEEAEKEVATLTAMTPSQRQAYGEKERQEQIDTRQQYFNKKIVLRNKYEAMLQKAAVWNPPTAEHVELKNFMIKQIQESIEFDCNTKYDLEDMTRLSNISPVRLFDEALNTAQGKVTRYVEEVRREQQRVEESNRWILALYESLGVEYDATSPTG